MVLRWIAIAGQLGAVFVASELLVLQFPVVLCLVVIGLSILANFLAIFLFPENRRLREPEAAAIVVFDICQLLMLIFLTGGLNNPFALMVLAPIAVSAAALRIRSIALVVTLALALITLVAVYHVPLRYADGTVLQIPFIMLFGFWIGIGTGCVFIATLIRRISDETHTMGDALLATQLALAREQKLTDLGGVVAAAAHELGTPLATIKLASSELSDELEKGSVLHQDAVLIGQQTDRCRDILRTMGRVGGDDPHMRFAPLEAVLEEAAEPHLGRGKKIHFDLSEFDAKETAQPSIRRAPEIIHGLRNLIQNAVDFSGDNVWIIARWDEETITVRITDDGAGFPAHVLGRIGDPFMRRRTRFIEPRPEYEGMGLGLFIAKTLLERTGANLVFANGSDPFLKDAELPAQRGAVVDVVWPRANISDTEGRAGSAEVSSLQPQSV